MDITVAARNAEIHPNFREYIEEKLAKVTQFYPRAQRVDVELTHQRNPRQADTAERIELTVFGKGPIIRAEAESADRYAAVDIAAGKLFERLRRMRDRAKKFFPPIWTSFPQRFPQLRKWKRLPLHLSRAPETSRSVKLARNSWATPRSSCGRRSMKLFQ